MTDISIRNLYKVYGDNPKVMMQYLLKGMVKKDLLDEHNHVLGLNNINLDIDYALNKGSIKKNPAIFHYNKNPRIVEAWKFSKNVKSNDPNWSLIETNV